MSKSKSNAAQASAEKLLEVQLRDMVRLHEVSTRLAGSLEMEPILDELLHAVVDLEQADLGMISLCINEDGTEYLQIEASVGFSDKFLSTAGIVRSGEGACGSCLACRQRVIIEDVEYDPLFESFRDVAREEGFRSVHSTPLIARNGRLVGVLSTHFRHQHKPTDR